MKTALQTGKLSGLAAGRRFSYGGMEWIMLERQENAFIDQTSYHLNCSDLGSHPK
jgi:hypothetical protein